MATSSLVNTITSTLFLLAATSLSAQEGIRWYTWEEGMVKAEKENKKFVIDLYTEWCGWCKKMDASTFSDPAIVQFVNEHYIAIKFDAEYKEDILFEGEIHSYTKSGKRGYNSLAAKITNGRLSYPTVVFLDENKKLIQAIPGFQGTKTFSPILSFFAFDMHKKMPWANYLREYNEGGRIKKQPNNNGILVGQEKN